MSIDLAPAARMMATVVRGVTSEQLGRPTPCGTYTVADLLEHIGGVALAFTEAAEKTVAADSGPPPPGDGARLAADWQQAIPAALDRLTAAWQAPGAFDGMTRAGGFDLPPELAASVAVEELVIHGWDLARATGQTLTTDDTSLAVTQGIVEQFSGNPPAYGEPLVAPAGASPLERVVALSGRDIAWTAP